MITSQHAVAANWEPSLLVPASFDLLWGTLAFIVIAVVMWKFAVPKFLELLDERAELIEGGIKKAERMQAEMAAREDEAKATVDEALKEAAQIREDARAEHQQMVDAARADAEAEVERVQAHASRQIEAERSAAQVSLRREIGVLAVELAEKVVGEKVDDPEVQSRIIDRFLADLERETVADSASGEGTK